MAWIRAMGGGSAEKKAENLFLNDIANFPTINNPNNSIVVSQNKPIVLKKISNVAGYENIISGYIDLTDYTTLRFKAISSGGYVSCIIRNEDDATVLSKQAGDWQTSATLDETIDVTKLSGKHTILIGFYSSLNNATLSIVNCELKVPTYLYKDGNVREQTVPLYTNGLQNVAWDNSGYKYKSNWTSGGGATIDVTSFVVDVPSGTTQTKSIVTDAPIDFTPYSKVVIEYDNGKSFEFNVSNVSESGYLTIGAYRNTSSDYGTLIRVSSTKDNFASTYLAEGTITYQATSMRVSKVKLVKSVAKATNKDAVDWDNRGYDGNSSFLSAGGFNVNDANLTVKPTVNKTNAIFTENAVDLSEYSTLKMLYDDTKVASVDVSAIKSSIYIAVDVSANYESYALYLRTSPQKADFFNYSAKFVLAENLSSNRTFTINRVWLEK